MTFTVAPAQRPGQISGSAVSEQQAQTNNDLSQGKGNCDCAHLVGSQPAYKIGVYQGALKKQPLNAYDIQKLVEYHNILKWVNWIDKLKKRF